MRTINLSNFHQARCVRTILEHQQSFGQSVPADLRPHDKGVSQNKQLSHSLALFPSGMLAASQLTFDTDGR